MVTPKPNTLGKFRPILTFGLASTFVVYEFLLRVVPSAMTHELMQSFSISARGLGIISALFYYGYTPMQIPVGLFFDRWSARTLLTVATLGCAIATIIFGMTSNVIIAGIARYFIGFGSAFAFVGALVVAARWFDAKYFAFMAGMVQFMGAIGAIGGEAPIAALVKEFGWRATTIGTGLCGIIIAVTIWALMREHPEKAPKAMNVSLNEWEKLKIVTKNPQMWAIALYGFAIWGPMAAFAALWGVPYMATLYHTSATVAAGSMSWAWMGAAIGSPVFGWWSGAIGNRRIPLATSAAICVVTTLIILYVPSIPWTLMCVLLFVFGISAAGQVVSFAVVQDNMPHTVAGTAVGFQNMAVITGGILFQPLVGFLLHANWTGEMTAAGVHLYTIANYQTALVILPICGVLGMIASLWMIKETHCTSQVSS